MKRFFAIFIFALAFTLGSCGGRGGVALRGGDTLYMPRHARGFVVQEAGGGMVLNINDPWQGAEGITQSVFLAGEGIEAPAGFEGVALRVPLRSVVCMSSTYIAYLAELGLTEAVKGVSGAKYISNPDIRRGYAQGRILDVGYDTGMNFELLSALRPDVVLAYGITGENSLLSGKLEQLGIDVVYIGDYVEQSPLGKAEWMVALGYMFGCEDRAREIFAGIEERYTATAGFVHESLTLPADVEEVAMTEFEPWPSVMLNAPYRDTWFVPGDGSYMVRLIRDAGGAYACAGDPSDRSRPISLEEAYIKMHTASVWLNPGQAATLDELRAENPRFASTPPVLGKRVYNCNRRRTPDGGSDFWESGAARPDVVLRDMVRIIRPELMPEHELYYFNELE